jgi:hypothetical protein
MPVKYFEHQGFLIDVASLVGSKFNRWVGYMESREIELYHRDVYNHDDVTGDIVLIGGLGIVDGFSHLDNGKPKPVVPVIIFELRNAERFIYHELGPDEKDRAGRFKEQTIIGQRVRYADMQGYQKLRGK